MGMATRAPWQRMRQAFPSPLDRLGCGVDGCSGYELLADLDFDTDGDGALDSGDDYWNDGDGWEPIGWDSTDESARFFNATFDGNRTHPEQPFHCGTRRFSGLFGKIGSGGGVDDLTLIDVNVAGTEAAGALVRGEPRPSQRHPVVGASIWRTSRRGTGRAQSEARLPLPQLRGGNGNEPATASRHRHPRYFRAGVRPPAGWWATTPVSSSPAMRRGPVTSDSSAGGLVGSPPKQIDQLAAMRPVRSPGISAQADSSARTGRRTRGGNDQGQLRDRQR